MRTLLRSTFVGTLLLVAACSSAKQSVNLEDLQLPVILPTLSFEPSVWETVGSETQPALRFDLPSSKPYEIEFEYEGDGDLELPERAWVAEGDSEAQFEGSFRTEPSEEPGAGVVTAYLVDDESGDRHAVGEWTVLMRPSIINDLEVIRTRALDDGKLYACLVAVNYDPMEGGHEAPADRTQHVKVTASVERQGRFAPETQVTMEVTRDQFSDLPVEFRMDGGRPVYYVAVDQPDFPQVRRAYLNIEVTIGGDTAKKYIALPNR